MEENKNLEMLHEDIENIRAYEKAKAEPGEFVPFEEAVRQIKSKSRR